MHKTTLRLDGLYAAFGKIIEGMEVVDRIASVETDVRDWPLKEQRIKKVTVDTTASRKHSVSQWHSILLSCDGRIFIQILHIGKVSDGTFRQSFCVPADCRSRVEHNQQFCDRHSKPDRIGAA